MTRQLTGLILCWLLVSSPATRRDVRQGHALGDDVRTSANTTHQRTPVLTTDTVSSPETVTANISATYIVSNGTITTSSTTEEDDDNEETEDPLTTDKRDEGLLSKEQYERLLDYLKISSAPILTIGIVTNVVAILVFMRTPTKSVTTTFFCLTSGLDVAYLLSSLPLTFMAVVAGQNEALQIPFYLFWAIYVSGYVTTTTRKVIVCVTMMMSLDRYLVIAFPIRMRTLHHLRRPLLYTLLVGVLAFLIDINVLLKNRIFSVNSDNQTVWKIAPTDMLRENTHIFIDIGVVSSFFFQYFPLTMLVVFNILLVMALVKHSRRMKSKFGGDLAEDGKQLGTVSVSSVSEDSGISRVSPDLGQGQMVGQGQNGAGKGQGQIGIDKSSQERSRLQRQKSVTVLVYSFIFVILTLPSTFFPLLRKAIPGFMAHDREHYLVLVLGSVFSLLDVISSAMNFFVYLTTGSAFRAGVCKLFRVCGRN